MTTREIKQKLKWLKLMLTAHPHYEPNSEFADRVEDIDEILQEEDENISDGYHSFKELYEFRKVYNAALFNEWAGDYNYAKGINNVRHDVHKSKRHHDGELCFGGGWFIVVAVLPTGQISNHYPMEDWDLFNIPEYEKAKYPFDGHTPQDVLERLKNL